MIRALTQSQLEACRAAWPAFREIEETMVRVRREYEATRHHLNGIGITESLKRLDSDRRPHHRRPGGAVMEPHIRLSKGRVALVDREDVDWLSAITWHTKNESGLYYALHMDMRSNKLLRMHRLIIGAAPGQIVDHINGDTLDNRRGNLRFVTMGQNAQNRGSRRGSSSKYTGVTWHRGTGKWQASIGAGASYEYLGVYSDQCDAARAYDTAATKRYGEYARLNFPSGSAAS